MNKNGLRVFYGFKISS